MTSHPHSQADSEPDRKELLACPFCGGHSFAKRYYNGETTLFAVECQSCQAAIRGFDQSISDAVDAWNTRATPFVAGRKELLALGADAILSLPQRPEAMVTDAMIRAAAGKPVDALIAMTDGKKRSFVEPQIEHLPVQRSDAQREVDLDYVIRCLKYGADDELQEVRQRAAEFLAQRSDAPEVRGALPNDIPFRIWADKIERTTRISVVRPADSYGSEMRAAHIECFYDFEAKKLIALLRALAALQSQLKAEK